MRLQKSQHGRIQCSICFIFFIHFFLCELRQDLIRNNRSAGAFFCFRHTCIFFFLYLFKTVFLRCIRIFSMIRLTQEHGKRSDIYCIISVQCLIYYDALLCLGIGCQHKHLILVSFKMFINFKRLRVFSQICHSLSAFFCIKYNAHPTFCHVF